MWVEELCGAIVKQAVVDYEKFVLNGDKVGADCETFFCSDWFVALTKGNIDSEVFLNMLNEKIKNDGGITNEKDCA